MYFDTHAHLNFAAFVKDRDRVIRKCLKDDIWLINVGTNLFTSQKAVEIAQKYDEGVYAAVGLHPINLDTGLIKMKVDEDEDEQDSPFEQEFDYEKYKKLAQEEKVVAIGEIGLDYYWKPKTKKKLEQFKREQDFLFHQEVRLAAELDLPIIIHCRMAHEDLLKTLKKLSSIYDKKLRGVVHCFTGTWEQAKEYMRLGFYIGFNGIIFKLSSRARGGGLALDKIVKKVPLKKILIETDCPYLSPPNYNQKRNDPMGVKFVAREIARIKKVRLEEIADQTTKNAQKLFISISP
jgi:TatD DNase family protein